MLPQKVYNLLLIVLTLLSPYFYGLPCPSNPPLYTKVILFSSPILPLNAVGWIFNTVPAAGFPNITYWSEPVTVVFLTVSKEETAENDSELLNKNPTFAFKLPIITECGDLENEQETGFIALSYALSGKLPGTCFVESFGSTL